MRNSPTFIRAVTVSLAIMLSMLGVGGAPSSPVMGTAAEAQPVGSGQCGLSQAAFCDTFDQPAGTGNRSGQLNGTVWGVSRTTGDTNLGQGTYDASAPTHLQGCSGSAMVVPDNDVIVCNGQLREASNDNHVVTTLAMYPKQPFDFAGRTGTVTFDVSNDTHGTHSAWPEFWITDQPVPAPFTHFGNWISNPRNGFGVRFAAEAEAGRGSQLAPTCPDDSNAHWTVDSAVVVRKYVADDQANNGAIRVTVLDCVTAPVGTEALNHVELHISQSQIDVYATDAGTTSPLKHIAVIQNANLTFTRGLIWIEDVHYNASKGNPALPLQDEHTFAWDNVGFDGPVLARDLTFDVSDALTSASNGGVNLGWLEAPNAAQTKTITGVTNVSDAAAALLMFNFFAYTSPSAFTYVVNGNWHSAAWPYPETLGYTWRTLALPVPLAEVLTGTNTVSITSNQAMVVANVDLLLVGAGGGGGSSISASQEQPTAVPPTAEPTSPPQVAAVSPLVPTVSRAALNADGGDLAANQISLRVPAGVVGPGGGELNLLPLDPQSVPAPVASVQPTNTAFVIALSDSSTGTQISQPSSSLALLYHLSQAEINQAGGDPSRLQIVNWSGDEWVSLACTTDAADLNCSVPHLGLFALVLAPPPSDTPDE